MEADSRDTEMIERLEAAARDRWGEGWTIETQKYADGTVDAHAYKSLGLVDSDSEEKVLERERLMPGEDGEIHHDTIRYKPRDVIETSDAELVSTSTEPAGLSTGSGTLGP